VVLNASEGILGKMVVWDWTRMLHRWVVGRRVRRGEEQGDRISRKCGLRERERFCDCWKNGCVVLDREACC